MKKFVLAMLAVSAVVFAFAVNQPKAEKDVCGDSKAQALMTMKDGDCAGGVCKPEAKVVKVEAKQGGCCAEKAVKAVKVEAKQAGCCADKAGKVEAKVVKEGKTACCQSTNAKPVAKAGAGCCNEAGKPAKFKVFADGKWMFFGCKTSAEKGRSDLLKMAFKVGTVQTVTGKVMMPKNQSLI